MRLGLSHPMGPFEVADFVGLDVLLGIARQMHDASGDEGDRPSPLLVERMEQGTLGRGFYHYSSACGSSGQR